MLTIVWFAVDAVLYSRFGRGVENYVYDLSIVGPVEVALGIVWLWGVNVARIAMGLMLLELKDEPSWRWPLRLLVILQVCLIIAATSVQLAICRPLSSVWSPTPDAQCISNSGLLNYAYVYNGTCLVLVTTGLPIMVESS